MSGWHSLSGSLQYKSGNNAFGRLITKRRTWCVLEESECKLLVYKTEEDVHKQRAPQGDIDLSGAAISLDLENQNQFVIISKKKEHVFTADNHESMMVWLLGLQSRREMHHKNMAGLKSYGSQYEDQHEIRNHRPHLYMTNKDPAMGSRTSNQRTMSEHCLTKRGQYGLQRAAESVDSGITAYKKGLEVSKSLPLSPFVSGDLGRCGGKKSVSHNHLPADSDSDDVFAREIEFHRQHSQTLSRNWRKLQYAVLGHVLESRHLASETSVGERRSASSRSASSDSAIEKGEGSAQELTTRLGELERELISTKCELAKVMNRQTCYQELLLQKDDTIKHLAGGQTAGGQTTTDTQHVDNKKISKQNKVEKEFQERIRVLQNQNRFLNEEVKKLAKLRFQEHGEFEQQNVRLDKLEADIEKWKMDYVSVIQSTICYRGDEGIDDVDLCLYGGDKHKTRIRTMLDDARKINPSLPTYESLMNQEVHVDIYGFKHVYANTGLVLHYLCTELTHHFLLQAGVYEEHHRKWTCFMRQHGKHPLKCRSELKSLCRGGIPDRFRKQIWQHLVRDKVKDLIHTKGDYYYRNLCNLLPESPLAACYRKQVSLDLMRTMPNNIKFSTSGCKGIMDLQDVLLAFCIHNPTIGYCQGMNFIAGMSLIFLDAEDSFWMLVAVAESYFSPHYFDHSLIGAQADQQVLKDIVREKLPALYQHLESIDIELCTITLNWFLAIFFDAVPFQTLLRIWDCFLLEGPKVLFRFSLSILKLHEREILQKSDTMGIMKHLKACAKLTYDVEGLLKLSFEGLKPFPKRKDIISKQTCYLKALKEKYKKKELQRLAFAEREQLYMNMEAECGMFLGIECAVAAAEGQVWLCYGDQHIGKLSFVSCETGTMFNIDFKLDSRLMCMCFMSPNELLLGTISWMLVSVDIHKHEKVWQIQLHDAILSVCCYDDDEASGARIFSGLADGTVAVTEKAYIKAEPSVDVMYIVIGQAPVTCLMLLDEQLWCASGNTVAVIHAKTLDTMDTFSVSVNPYDHILSLQPSNYGIWISLRGSSILELWDPRTLNCRMLYDTRTDRYPQLRKEDDTYFNRARITSTLANGNTVWIGTGEGNLIIYEILESTQLKTPTEMSPSAETTSSMSYIVRPEKMKEHWADLGHSESGQRMKRGYHLYEGMDINEDTLHLSDGKGDKESKVSENTPVECSQCGDNNKMSIRRISSSENDLGNLQKTHYRENLDKCHTPGGALPRVFSQNDIEQLEKQRNLSYCNDECFMKHTVEEEDELKQEAFARRVSLTTLLNAEHLQSANMNKRGGSESSGRSCRESVSSRKSSVENKRKPIQQRKLLISDAGRSDHEDSGCESNKAQYRKSRTSCSSSRRSSLSRRGSGASGKCKHEMLQEVDTNDMSEEEDVFEARLEEQARRESLVLNEIDINCSSLVHMKNVTGLAGSCLSQSNSHEEGGSMNVVNICIDHVADVDETDLEQIARRQSLLGIELYNLDDSYVSSSPSSCVSQEFPQENFDFQNTVEESTDKKCNTHTTALGMSISSIDDIDLAKTTNHCSNHHPAPVTAQGCKNTDTRYNSETEDEIVDTCESLQGDTEVEVDTSTTFETNHGRRLSVKSVLEDVSALCSDCTSQKRKCMDCKKLLESQESLRITEKRMSERDLKNVDLLPDSKCVVREVTKLNGVKGRSCDESTEDAHYDGKLVEHAEHVESDTNQGTNCNTGNELKSVRVRKQEIMDKVYDVSHELVNLFSNEKMDKSDLSRQEKVGIWLNSISHTFSLQDGSMDSDGQDTTNEINLLKTSQTELINNTDSGIMVSCCEGPKSQEEKTSQNGYHSNKDSIDEEDVFYNTEETSNHKTERASPDRPATFNLLNRVSGGISRISGGRIGSGGSDGSSGRKSQVEAVLNKKDSGTQYRLDFSSMHVETDVDSEHTTSILSHPSSQVLHRRARYGSGDSRKNSLDLGSIQEKCSRLDSECTTHDQCNESSVTGTRHDQSGTESVQGSDSNRPERQQMFELLKTPSLASRHASLGLKIIDDDLEWTELYSAQCTTPSPTSTTDKRLADFLRTPSMSSKPCSMWSSYENISTPSQFDDGKFLHPLSHSQRRISHSPSTASIGSDLLYNVDLNLEAKMKISDKPVKCLLLTSFKNEAIILSFSGSYGDDEAVLKWRKHENEQLWTNEPVLEICSKTNQAILPTYMRRRMSSNSSFNSH